MERVLLSASLQLSPQTALTSCALLQEAQTPEMGNVLRGRDPFTPKESHGYSRKKFKSDLLRKSELSVRPRSYEERNGRASPVYDPNPPRCYEWSKLKHPPPSDPLLRPVVPPPRQLHQPNAGNGPSEAPHVYENVVVKVSGCVLLTNGCVLLTSGCVMSTC